MHRADLVVVVGHPGLRALSRAVERCKGQQICRIEMVTINRGHRLTCNLSRRRSLLAGQLALRRHLERVRDLVPDVRHEHVQTFALAAAGATLEAEPVVHDAVSSADLG